MDGDHDRFGQVDQLSPDVPLPANLTGDDLRRRGTELGQVGAGAKGSTLPGDEQHANIRVFLRGRQRRCKIIPHRH